MITDCFLKRFLENHDEDIENTFTKNKSNKEKAICYELSHACDGIDTTEKKPSDNADLNLSGGGEGESVSQTVKINPNTGKAEKISDASKLVMSISNNKHVFCCVEKINYCNDFLL